MRLNLIPDSHYSQKAATKNSTKTEEEHNLWETWKNKNNRSETSGHTYQTNPDIS